MTMFNPPHPCSILKEDVLHELGISVTEAAAQLGVSRMALSRLINGKAGLSASADMAILLETWLKGQDRRRKAGLRCRPSTICGRPDVKPIERSRAAIYE